ncbi:MAG: Glycosyltransferase [Parcubacteria group bacterium Gr01-1014_73]|nr:MAG: Glycosyltransferase [Parcubacteria group bacterium Gr01-1014_73]
MIFRKLNVKGGTQRQGLSLANELRRRGHEIVIYTLYYSPENCYPHLLKNFPVRVLRKEETEKNKLATYYPVLEKTGLPEILNENRQAKKLAAIMDDDFDVLNPHDQVAYKVAVYYKKFKKNIPSVWNMNDLPLKRWGFDRAHGCDDNFHQPWYKHIAYWLFDFYDKQAFIKKQDAIVVVDHFNKELVKKYINLNASTVRSGPDFEYFTFKEKMPPKNSIKILTSGILMPHRRFEDTINALPMLNAENFQPTLTIIGDIDNDKKYYVRLRALVSKLKLENQVFFKGKVTDEELIRAYQEHDVYIFQHHLQSDGLSPFEAVACGLPIIVSKTAGCHEVLTDKENALFIEPKNPADIAEKISLLLTDHALYSKIAKNGNAFARQNFSWQKYADGILELMEKAIKKN